MPAMQLHQLLTGWISFSRDAGKLICAEYICQFPALFELLSGSRNEGFDAAQRA